MPNVLLFIIEIKIVVNNLGRNNINPVTRILVNIVPVIDCENNTPHTTAMEQIKIPKEVFIMEVHCIENVSGMHRRITTLNIVDEKCIKAIHATIDVKKLINMHGLV